MSFELQGASFTAYLDGETGRLRSFRAFGEELLAADAGEQPLFEMRLYDPAGKRFVPVTDMGAERSITCEDNACTIRVWDIQDAVGLVLCIRIRAGETLEYTTEIQNDTCFYVESIACPCVQITRRLRENGGEGAIFWARAEGVLITDALLCPQQTLFSRDGSTPMRPARFLYPGVVTMQYLAFMTLRAAVYFAAHDKDGMPKAIAPLLTETGLRLDLRLYPCAAPGTRWQQRFPVLLRPFQGGWEAAAELYRTFLEQESSLLPPKLAENPVVPDWVEQSPVIVIYPPRSVRGTDYIGPNEYFPYTNGLKYLADLKQWLRSSVMAFLPYWEGSAPWAPPFCWPPYGGAEAFDVFVQQMHKNGDLVGLYASGLHWTDQSYIDPSYTRSAYREVHGLTDVMCRQPNGELQGGPCPSIRKEYAMCCACEPTRKIAMEQLHGMACAGVDYVQLFDQHMGGEGTPCYAAHHAHPPCFGAWNTGQMKSLYTAMTEKLQTDAGQRLCAIGTEGAAADFYCGQIPVSEARGHLGFALGQPVPAASYVLHEYTCNFMDNMCCVHFCMDRQENPDSILYTLAYHFIAGNMLTLVLKSGGEIHYDWGQSWLEPGPRQRPVLRLVRNLNGLRSSLLRSFLIGGRMLPLRPFRQPGTFSMTRLDGSVLTVPEVLSSCWENYCGERIQIFVNYRDRDIEIVPQTDAYIVLPEDKSRCGTGGHICVPALNAAVIRHLA